MFKDERDIEKKLRKLVEKYDGLCLKWICPGWSGVPDRIVLLPGGTVLFIETKRPNNGRISELQTWWARRLQRLGFWHLFVHDKEDLRAVEFIIVDSIERKRGE